MKKIIIALIVAAGATITFSACNEKEFLKEVPATFLSPENAYVTEADYTMALTGLYASFRNIYFMMRDGYHNTGHGDAQYFSGTDVIMPARDGSYGTYMMDYLDVWLTPQCKTISNLWDDDYKLIANANAIVSRVEKSDLDENVIKQISAEARFFRAYTYRNLVYLFGGVPLVVEETASAKTDYVRASKQDVLEAMKTDFELGAKNLPDINNVAADGRVSSQVAKFFLAETLMSLGDNAGAITNLSEIISSNNVKLMTSRFGSHKSEEGDVFWDLFRKNNQNRSGGNTEALWVEQFETDATGGFNSSSNSLGFALERCANPNPWKLNDPNGASGLLKVSGSARASNLNCGGGGCSFLRATDWWMNELWGSDFDNDIRNSKYNVVRDCIYDNPGSKYYGESMIYGDHPSPGYVSTPWRWYPWPSKTTSPGDHPSALYLDKSNGILNGNCGITYQDWYILRLPEVYFLRAEAYLNTGDKSKAAADLNVVRSRANASPCSASDVDIDYILDERARELIYEEFRRVTLGRLGMYVSRTKAKNPYSGAQLSPHHELWPIPYSAIEANKDAVLKQHDGYTN